MTRFILDSGDPQEYRNISQLSQKHGKELWGGTTNPTLIAKKLSKQKLTSDEAFQLQKEIILEILNIVPGVVSAEVYADQNTKASEMIEQGREIASWHERVAVKLPTNLEAFKARTTLRKENILTNNTLVFSQQQIFAICLHEHLVAKTFGERGGEWPPFISPFVGRLDDIGEDGLRLVEHGMTLKKLFPEDLWMLEASVRSPFHITEGIALGTELITVPASVYTTWLLGEASSQSEATLSQPTLWEPSEQLLQCDSLEQLERYMEDGTLDISHPLTDKGIIRFAQDWQAILK